VYPALGEIDLSFSFMPFDIYLNFPELPSLYLPNNPGSGEQQYIPDRASAISRPAPTDGNTVAIWSAAHVWVCKDFLLSSAPQWNDITPSDLAAYPTGQPLDFAFDGFGSGAYLLGLVNGSTQSAIWYTTNVFAPVVTWTKGATQTGANVFAILKLTSTRSQVFIFDNSDIPPKVRISSDNGATFGGDISVGAGGGAGGFDAQKVGAVSLAADAGDVYRATTFGGAYSLYATMPASSTARKLWIPRYQFGGSTANDGSDVQFLVASRVDGGTNEYLWKVTAAGATFTNITPQVGADYGRVSNIGAEQGPLMPWQSGNIIAAALQFGANIRLVTSNNAGTSWTDRGTLTTGYQVKMRRGDTSLNQIFIADSTFPRYSPDRGDAGRGPGRQTPG
jgi:hypothetical protein